MIGVLVAQGCTFVKTLQIPLRFVHFIEYKLYLEVGGGMASGSNEKVGLRGLLQSLRRGAVAWTKGRGHRIGRELG